MMDPPTWRHGAAGFTDVSRVGSLQRIAKPLLRYSLHSSEDQRDAASQLRAMLTDAVGAEAEMIRSAAAHWSSAVAKGGAADA